MIAGLLLAAGRSSRFGGEKLLALLHGRPLIRWSAESLAAAVQVAYVVTPPETGALSVALSGVGVVLIPHSLRDEGMASSIAAGVSALPPEVEAVVIALGDQPLISAVVVARLCACWRSTHAPAVIVRYRDGVGHPVLFDRSCFDSLMMLRGDAGARVVLDDLGAAVAEVEVDGVRPVDVDTRDALERLSGGGGA